MIKSKWRPKVDGDQISVFAVKNPKFHPLFLTMCPTYAFIDKANGKFNNNMDFRKDYAALISAAYDIDRMIDDYLTHPDEGTYELMQSLGLEDGNKDEYSKISERIGKGIIEEELYNFIGRN